MSTPIQKTNRPGKPKKKKRFGRRAGPLCWLVSLIVFIVFGYFLFELIAIDILPVSYLIIVCLVSILITAFILYFWLIKTRRQISRIFFGILAVCLGVVYGLGGYYLRDTSDMFEEVTNLTDKAVNVVSVYGMISREMYEPEDLDGGVLGIVDQLDPQGTAGIVSQLKEQGVKFNTVSYPDAFALVDSLLDGQVDAIALPEQLHDMVYEAATDTNNYSALTTFTNILDQYIYYTDRSEIMENPANPVNNIMRNPFVVLISGNDSYGTLSNVSRSDVNMLVAVNPATAQILMISIPRDTYVEISCKKNASACEAIAGQSDKLTHTGIYGVATTESTLEDFLGIEINYTVRVNFSSLINIIDAIGGIDVDVEEGLEVETFYSNGLEGVHAGINHLNGERALAFVRERYAYSDGDNQRVRNQQIVLKALIQDMMSPAMVVNYPRVMKALSTAFETNMTAKELKSLLTLEITRFPKWNIQSYALTNEPATAYSPGNGAYASVTIASESEVAYAVSLIKEVLNGAVPVVDKNYGSYDTYYDYTYDYDYSYDDESSYTYDEYYDYSYDQNSDDELYDYDLYTIDNTDDLQTETDWQQSNQNDLYWSQESEYYE